MKKNALFFIEMILLRHRYVDSDSVKHFNNSKPCYCQESFIGYNTLPRKKTVALESRKNRSGIKTASSSSDICEVE
jgi:hypothetical protein